MTISASPTTWPACHATGHATTTDDDHRGDGGEHDEARVGPHGLGNECGVAAAGSPRARRPSVPRLARVPGRWLRLGLRRDGRPRRGPPRWPRVWASASARVGARARRRGGRRGRRRDDGRASGPTGESGAEAEADPRPRSAPGPPPAASRTPQRDADRHEEQQREPRQDRPTPAPPLRVQHRERRLELPLAHLHRRFARAGAAAAPRIAAGVARSGGGAERGGVDAGGGIASSVRATPSICCDRTQDVVAHLGGARVAVLAPELERPVDDARERRAHVRRERARSSAPRSSPSCSRARPGSSPSWMRRPVLRRKPVAASAKRSVRPSISSMRPAACSGDMNDGVPSASAVDVIGVRRAAAARARSRAP